MKHLLFAFVCLMPVCLSAQETMPEFPGGDQELMIFIMKSLRYPALARELGMEGKVITQFVINVDGSITDIQVLNSLGCGCDEEAVRVIKLMPLWKPGTQNGTAVKTTFRLPMTFKLGGPGYPVNNPGTGGASFGGDKALKEYIKKNVKYPEEAKRNRVKGDVEVKFTVLKDGATDNIQIIKSLGSGCDEEAIRVIRSMPHWTAAHITCKPVEEEQTLIIHFPSR